MDLKFCWLIFLVQMLGFSTGALTSTSTKQIPAESRSSKVAGGVDDRKPRFFGDFAIGISKFGSGLDPYHHPHHYGHLGHLGHHGLGHHGLGHGGGHYGGGYHHGGFHGAFSGGGFRPILGYGGYHHRPYGGLGGHGGGSYFGGSSYGYQKHYHHHGFNHLGGYSGYYPHYFQ